VCVQQQQPPPPPPPTARWVVPRVRDATLQLSSYLTFRYLVEHTWGALI
jgi:hypothetical protein